MSKRKRKKLSPEIKMPGRKRNLPVASIIFFICTYLYVSLVIDSRLIYHSFGTIIAYPAFSVDWEFFKNSLSYPGGVAEYVGNFLSQLYYFSWLGAAIITAVALLLYFAAKILVKSSVGARSKLISYVPVVILLMIYNRYDNQMISFITFLAALWFTVAYVKVEARKSYACVIVFLIMFSLLYYIAGGACFIFAVLVTVYEIFLEHRRILGGLFMVTAIGFYLFARYFYDIEVKIVHMQLLTATSKPDSWIRILLFGLYFYLPLFLFGAGLRQVLGEKNKIVVGFKKLIRFKLLSTKKPVNDIRKNKLKAAIRVALPIAIIVVCLFVTFDGTKKKLVQVDYFACNEMWPEVLRTARRIRPESNDIFSIHDINRALYHTGRLGDDMFGYPQKLQALILTVPEASKPSGRVFLKRSRLLLQLGHIGIAERDAFECLELAGNSPAILEHLATIKVVKGQTEAAKVFLRALSRDLIFGNRGRQMLKRIEQDPDLANDKSIQQIRSVIPDKDSVSFDYGAGEFFQQLLDKNPYNRLAFEYLMAVYLLTGQVDQIVSNIGHLNKLGYQRIPRCYEEAILIYIGMGNTKIDLKGWKLTPEIINRIKEIDRIFRLKGGIYDEQGVRSTLGADYADSYFLYYLFELSGAGR